MRGKSKEDVRCLKLVSLVPYFKISFRGQTELGPQECDFRCREGGTYSAGPSSFLKTSNFGSAPGRACFTLGTGLGPVIRVDQIDSHICFPVAKFPEY